MNLLKRTTVLLAATLVLGAAGCSKSNDGAITTRVKHAISKEASLKETKVAVSTDQRVVHLSGTVKSREERATLIAVARKVEGVKSVKTDLVVATPEKPAVQAKPKTKRKPVAQAQAKPKQKPRTTKLVAQPAATFEGTGR
jgi:hypothetical protein